MLVHCTGTLRCGETILQQVDEFKYLGLKLTAICQQPDGLLRARLLAARRTFNAVRANCRWMGISNSRVKLQLVSTLATSVLLYGSVLYACLGNVRTTLHANIALFESVEAFVRVMYRWALGQSRDLRGSFVYAMANQPSVQVLTQKACLRFFRGLEERPRFATNFVKKLVATIDHDILGTSTLTWWDWVDAEFASPKNTKPFYQQFRHVLSTDLRRSQRLSQTGLTDMFCSILRYCFAGELASTPSRAAAPLSELVHTEHSIVRMPPRRGKQRLLLSPQPSWLQRGDRRTITLFHDFFQGSGCFTPCSYTHCALCGRTIDSPVWAHILSPCPRLGDVSSDRQWTAFVQLLQLGYHGLALYSCFPMIGRYHDQIISRARGDTISPTLAAPSASADPGAVDIRQRTS